jgi:hypothetical protein
VSSVHPVAAHFAPRKALSGSLGRTSHAKTTPTNRQRVELGPVLREHGLLKDKWVPAYRWFSSD